MLDLLLLSAAAFASAFVGSVAGSGGTLVLLPVLVWFFGIRDAIPIITIANLSANLSRVLINRREIVYPVVGWFVLGTIHLSMSGAYVFIITAPETLTRMLGAFLILVIAWRRMRPAPPKRYPTSWFLPLGAVFGFLEGILGSVGPLMAPFFLAFGLVKGAYIGTDALATVAMQVSKLTVFGASDLLPASIIATGLTLVPFMILGTLVGKRMLDRLSERVFALVLESLVLIAALIFLIGE